MLTCWWAHVGTEVGDAVAEGAACKLSLRAAERQAPGYEAACVALIHCPGDAPGCAAKRLTQPGSVLVFHLLQDLSCH